MVAELQTIPGTSIDYATGAYKIQNCPVTSESSLDETLLLNKLEQEFQCAGICKQSSFYVYSNVNDGIPRTTCFEAL